MSAPRQSAVFLDRDGTLNVDGGYVWEPSKIVAIEGAGEALRLLLGAGYRLFLHTNQSGIHRGWYTLADVQACIAELERQMGFERSPFAEVCIAPEAPGEVFRLRKPRPDFVLQMRERHRLDPAQTYFVGDRLSDWQAALYAGVRPVAVQTGEPFGEAAAAFLARHPEVAVYPDVLAFARDRVVSARARPSEANAPSAEIA